MVRRTSCSFHFLSFRSYYEGIPSGTMVKNPAVNVLEARDLGSVPGLGRYFVVRNGYPLQYSSLENSTNRGPWLLQSMGLQKVGSD